MRQLPGRLGTLLARDIMTTNVVVLHDHMTLDQAIQTLRKVGHSGAPVVNEQGILVGTISVRDIFGTKKASDSHTNNEVSTASGTWMMWPLSATDASVDLNQLIRQKMRKEVYKITQFAPMLEAGRLICAHHLHRLPVIDSNERLVGLITPIDIIAALVNTADEQTDLK